MVEKVVRFGVSIEPELLEKFDTKIKKEGYKNRSEKIRDLVRSDILKWKIKDLEQNVVGTLTVMYDHHIRNLTNKLIDFEHEYHKNIISTTHIHLDKDNCLEILILKGKLKEVKKVADNIKAIKGVKHGELVVTQKNL